MKRLPKYCAPVFDAGISHEPASSKHAGRSQPQLLKPAETRCARRGVTTHARDVVQLFLHARACSWWSHRPVPWQQVPAILRRHRSLKSGRCPNCGDLLWEAVRSRSQCALCRQRIVAPRDCPQVDRCRIVDTSIAAGSETSRSRTAANASRSTLCFASSIACSAARVASCFPTFSSKSWLDCNDF